VTGGAGFIGSHLVDALATNGNNVSVFDNLTSGTLQNIKQWLDNPNFTFIKGDLLNPPDLKKLRDNYETIFHLAANPEVGVGSTNPKHTLPTKPNSNPQPPTTHKKNQQHPHTRLHQHIHRLRRTHKNPHTRKLCAIKPHQPTAPPNWPLKPSQQPTPTHTSDV
jgi:hypothetical protein